MRDLLKDTGGHHLWDLTGRRVTQLLLDPSSVRLQTWMPEGAAEVRIGVQFTLHTGAGIEHRLDPEQSEALSPVLPLLNRALRALVAFRSGELLVEFDDGASIRVQPHPEYEAWEANGEGELEGIAYLCSPGGGTPWG